MQLCVKIEKSYQTLLDKILKSATLCINVIQQMSELGKEIIFATKTAESLFFLIYLFTFIESNYIMMKNCPNREFSKSQLSIVMTFVVCCLRAQLTDCKRKERAEAAQIHCWR